MECLLCSSMVWKQACDCIKNKCWRPTLQPRTGCQGLLHLHLVQGTVQGLREPAAHFTSTSFLKQTKRSSFSHFKSIRQSAFFFFLSFSENAARFYLMKSYPVPRPSKTVTPSFFPGCIKYSIIPGKRLKRQIPNLSL